MKKALVFTMLFLMFNRGTGFAQRQEVIDSLHVQLASSGNDTSRIYAHIDLCYTYRLGNADSSLFYGQQALDLAQKINYPPGEILARGFMSITMGQLGKFAGALQTAFKA